MTYRATPYLRSVPLILLLALILPSLTLAAARGGPQSPPCPALNKQSNRIQMARAGMRSFYEKVHLLRKQDSDRVTILHMGDSHIQADMMTSVIRESLQAGLGNAGRGLIFPYSLARTNGPADLRIASNTTWRAQRSAWPTGDMPTGISGFAIGTSNAHAAINVGFRESTISRNLFNKITVYYDKSPETFEFSLAGEPAEADEAPAAKSSPYTATFVLPDPVSYAQLVFRKRKPEQKYGILYGISLENGRRGVLYHTAGVNGATFRTFNESAYFIPHVNVLKPDLVIISLGTNDVGETGFDSPSFRAHVDVLVKSIRKENPDTSILFTVLPDFGRPGSTLLKKKILRARGVIIDYCKNSNLAYWDLYEVMGGYGSMGQWLKSSLAQKDAMHFTRAGYELQGRLFFEALMDGLRDYESNRPE